MMQEDEERGKEKLMTIINVRGDRSGSGALTK